MTVAKSETKIADRTGFSGEHHQLLDREYSVLEPEPLQPHGKARCLADAARPSLN